MSTEMKDPRPGSEERGDRAAESECLRAVGAPRLLPAVAFGLRAAVLAGVVVVSSPVLPAVTAASAATATPSVVLTTTSLNGPFSGLTLDETTCCSANVGT